MVHGRKPVTADIAVGRSLPPIWPAYLALLDNGELERRVANAYARLEDCDLCARYCQVNRRQTLKGVVCRAGERAVVHGYGPHHGEENPLRGWAGSGTIFFTWCNLRCVFCQNWEISQKGEGREVALETLAGMMLDLQGQGCHNINLVTPSHVVPQILAATLLAARRGLRLPLVYNTGGYDSPEALALLDGVVDIYMPDMKYGDSETAHRYSHVRNYWAAAEVLIGTDGYLMLGSTGGIPMADKYLVDLTEEEQGYRLDVIHKGKTAARRVARAHVLLRAAEGTTDEDIAKTLQLGIASVHRIRQRCVDEGLTAALRSCLEKTLAV